MFSGAPGAATDAVRHDYGINILLDVRDYLSAETKRLQGLIALSNSCSILAATFAQ